MRLGKKIGGKQWRVRVGIRWQSRIGTVARIAEVLCGSVRARI